MVFARRQIKLTPTTEHIQLNLYSLTLWKPVQTVSDSTVQGYFFLNVQDVNENVDGVLYGREEVIFFFVF